MGITMYGNKFIIVINFAVRSWLIRTEKLELLNLDSVQVR